jgi:catechol 2,3-dioxygenase-like lactoylglutathione lyase family enzyme
MSLSSRDVLIQTPDIDAAAEFYHRTLGLTEFMRKDNMIGLEAGAFRLFLDRGTPYGPVFDFYVRDLETAKADLVKAGCVIEQEDPSIPRCYLRDPFGLTFNIEQR